LPTLTRSRVKALIESRRVALADGRTIEEPSRKVKTGERFVVDIPEPGAAEPLAQAMALDVLYEDDDLLVLNKPAGLAVQGGTKTDRHVDGLLPLLIKPSGERPRLVHRLVGIEQRQ
jgi:23S rRNA-/tRNA-specific pseudouridylate synthase